MDIQFSLDGAEGIDVFQHAGSGRAGPYDSGSDTEFYGNDLVLLASTVNLPGRFTLLFPHDLHRPQVRVANAARVKKAVVKLRLDAFFFRGES
jgi:YhcH/YjgK/YiaL family protein